MSARTWSCFERAESLRNKESVNGTELEHKFLLSLFSSGLICSGRHMLSSKLVSSTNECNGISSHFDRLEDI